MGTLRARSRRWTAMVLLAAAALFTGSISAAAASPATPAAGGSVDFRGTLQPIDGFGFSAAFARAALIRRLPADQQRQVVDLLLSPKDGAGLSILRLGIGSAPDGAGDNRSIEARSLFIWDLSVAYEDLA